MERATRTVREGAGSVGAELAFVVRDQWQNRGIGSALFRHLSLLAIRNGISGFTAEVLKENEQDHEYILDEKSPFNEWVHVALQYWNPHWAPQSEIHPRWREFELRPLHSYTGSHEKQTRPDNTWEQYYDEALLALVDKVYEEDLQMWKEASSYAIDTGTRRIL